MRSAVALAAFAAGALAVPFGHRHQHRALETDVHLVIKTDTVYVTADEPAPAAATPASSVADTTTVATPTATHIKVSEHENWSGNHGGAPAASSAVNTPSVVIITVPSTPTSTYVPPVSTSVAPVAVAPQQSSAPESSSSSEPSSTGSSDATPTSYQEIVVYHHNIHRRNHSAPDLSWSDNLAQSAAIIASSCDYNHNTDVMGGGYGQNIAAGVDSQNISSVITDLFYNGEVLNFAGLYGQAQPNMDDIDGWGHFSQVVWKATTSVGCATQYCPGGLANTGGDVDPYFTVCNYAAPGNMANDYGSNIGEPLGMPTAQWNTGL